MNKERIAGRPRFEPWKYGKGRRTSVRAIHDNLGFTLICLDYVAQIGGVYKKIAQTTRNGEHEPTILSGRVLRKVNISEVREWLGRATNPKIRLYGGHWYEVICD